MSLTFKIDVHHANMKAKEIKKYLLKYLICELFKKEKMKTKTQRLNEQNIVYDEICNFTIHLIVKFNFIAMFLHKRV